MVCGVVCRLCVGCVVDLDVCLLSGYPRLDETTL